MKKAFILFFCLAALIDAHQTTPFVSDGLSEAANELVEASLDKSLAYIIVTASLLGIIKLKKNPG